MKSKKIDFRITEQDYNEVLKKAEKAGISANAWAREVVLKAIVPISEPTSETGTNRSNNITPLSHMEISRELVRMKHYVEMLPGKSGIKNELEKGLENIWLTLS